jgi:hypothetical protein
MNQILVSEDALDSVKKMAHKLQEKRDMLLEAAIKAVNSCIRLGQQYGSDGFVHNEALAGLSEAIAKVERE